jgi:hypothetical protein
MRYFFHLVDRHGSILDEDGVEVADMGQLRAHAQKAVEELRSEDPSAAGDWRGWRLEVTDTSGAVLLTINLDPVSLGEAMRPDKNGDPSFI